MTPMCTENLLWISTICSYSRYIQFITPGSKLDDIAIHRATSIYLPNVTLPMLPSVLSKGKGLTVIDIPVESY